MNYLNIFWKSVQSYPAVQSNPTLPVCIDSESGVASYISMRVVHKTSNGLSVGAFLKSCGHFTNVDNKPTITNRTCIVVIIVQLLHTSALAKTCVL